MSHEFRPDWTIAPGEILRDWMEETGLKHVSVLAVACNGKAQQAAAEACIGDVLDRKPLTRVHAACLARGTGIPAKMWLALEHNYRAGLAAGLTDASS